GFDLKKQNYEKLISYFEKGPYNYAAGLDYVGGVEYGSSECFWFMHRMSEIINAVLQTDIEIQEFSEYNLEMANNEATRMLDGFPLSYILIGKKRHR
ncbi:MAG: hypothetical protein LBP82_03525, partial [Candidatus Methanoplasma sp.]|nr:hypothetical protein [Candidatus Methanoplasma sp.]